MATLNLDYNEFSLLRDLVREKRHSLWLKMVGKRKVNKDAYDKYWMEMEKITPPIGEDEIVASLCKKIREEEERLQKDLKE
jgi:hypothetical protein